MGRITVPATLQHPQKDPIDVSFTVDTAADRTIISKKTAKEAGLTKVGTTKIETATGEVREIPLYRTILKVKGCPTAGITLGALEGADNLLGADFLQLMRAKIDEEKHELICRERI